MDSRYGVMTAPNNMKVYVPVRVEFGKDGALRPRLITWEDGTVYEIDQVIDVRQAAALKAGGQGERFTVKIRGKESYLFFERVPERTSKVIGRWFVERR